jgi:hypothetical protein
MPLNRINLRRRSCQTRLSLFSDKSALSRAHDLLLMAQENENPAQPSSAPATPTQNPEKPPEEWATGKEPMTGPQRSYLQTLCREAGEEFNENLTKAEASKKIDELQTKTGRGKKS